MAGFDGLGMLFASFGTTHDDARVRCIDAVAGDLVVAFPGAPLAQAYTSSIVRRVLERRRAEGAEGAGPAPVPDVRGALAELAGQDVRRVIVQPGHLMPGHEYDKLRRQAKACADLFEQVLVGEPLLAGTDDVHRLIDIMAQEFPRQTGRAVVLMGHGSDHFANVVYEAMNFYAGLIGRDDMLIGTVEAEPSLATLLGLLARRPEVTRVTLAPLMLVAGDHAKNDMAGADSESWASQLRVAGYEVDVVLRGLGELPAVRRMYVEKALAAAQALGAEPEPAGLVGSDAGASGATGELR